ncbi:MAG: ATP-binding protein, partial [Deltaproteobacteria bacterium]
LYAFYLLSRTLTYSQLGRQGRRKRISFIAAGLITLTMLISDRLSEMGLPLPAVGNLFLVFYIYFIYQTITKQKVLDLEDLTAKALLFFVLAAMLTLIYAILVAWVEGIALFFFNTFVASFVILILFEPIKSLIERGISQFFLKGRLKIENQLDGLKRSLLETSDLRDLAHHVLVGLKNIFQATQAHFFLLDREEIKFNLIQSLEIDPAKTKISEMMISHDFVKYLAGRNMKPSSAYFIHREIEEGAGLIRERLKNTFSLFQSLNAEVAFPFALDGKMLGFCTFINDRADEPYPSKDLELLIPLSGQIALSLKNLEIYERIRERDRLATVGEMAAGLAHEIRNPLGAIKGAAQYLMPTQENTQQNEFLRIIVNEVDRLNKIVSQFLNYAKPLSQNLTETDLSELLQSTLQIISRDLPDNVHLTYQSRSYFAVVDPSLIQQVFLNIILNAIQAMPDGGELKISMRNIKKSVEMIFEDTGIGISEENLKKIFIPFFTTREGGTGLGLAISHKIVRAHQGNFHLESELRKGTKLIM